MAALRAGNNAFALFYALYGFGGLVLALALWRAGRQFRKPPAA